MEKPTLLILAAGMGSRYGGNKQIDAIDNDGHLIIDFSVYDAIRAGLGKVVFIVTKAIEADVRRIIGDKIAPFIEVEYCHQSLDLLPSGYTVPEGREKPWGTGHAVLAAKDIVKTPFVVINADDYYGRGGFSKLFKFLTTVGTDPIPRYAMVGYRLGNTLTDHGTVSRGVCAVDENGNLSQVVECTGIRREGDCAMYADSEGREVPLDLDSVVSMNFWGFSADFFDSLEQGFIEFLEHDLPKNPLKAEFYLPFAVDSLVKESKASVTVLTCDEKWFGVTFKADKPNVERAVEQMKSDGKYPRKLWANENFSG